MSIAASEPVFAESETRATRIAWFLGGCVAHLLAWAVLLAVLWLDVPWHAAIFRDFGMSLPSAVVALISASDFAVSCWYIVAPITALFAIGVVYLVVGLCRSPILRMALLVSLLLVPLAWAIWSHLLLTSATSNLIQSLT